MQTLDDLNRLIATLSAEGNSPERIAKMLPPTIGDDRLIELVRAHQAGEFRLKPAGV
jgi:hypothetical protein